MSNYVPPSYHHHRVQPTGHQGYTCSITDVLISMPYCTCHSGHLLNLNPVPSHVAWAGQQLGSQAAQTNLQNPPHQA